MKTIIKMAVFVIIIGLTGQETMPNVEKNNSSSVKNNIKDRLKKIENRIKNFIEKYPIVGNLIAFGFIGAYAYLLWLGVKARTRVIQRCLKEIKEKEAERRFSELPFI